MTTTSTAPSSARLTDRRIHCAATAIERFRADTDTDREDSLADLLADLMHWADRNGFDFHRELQRASQHHGAECRNDSDVCAPAPLPPGQSRGRYRVTVIEWLSHVAVVDAEDEEGAEVTALRLWADNSEDPIFRFSDSGIDEVVVDPA